MTDDTQVIELSLEKVIETKLVQANVTEQVLAAMKEKYGGLRLAALDDKESYLELKAAAKEVAKVRTLTVKLCKEGRERAVREQKLWVAKEKEIVGKVAEVEDVLDAEIKKYDDEVARKQAEEKERQEAAYIARQASITKMGATYVDGSFVLGAASFEANIVKGASDDIWSESILPKFTEEFEKIEAVRIAEEEAKKAEQERIKAEQEKLRQEQEEFRRQQEEFKRQQEEAARIEQKKRDEEAKALFEKRSKLNSDRFEEVCVYLAYGESIEPSKFWELSDEDFNSLLNRKKAAYEKHLEEEKVREQERIEAAKQEAIRQEQERQAELKRQEEIKKQQEEERKQAELDAASDKMKWAAFIDAVSKIQTYEMRSGQYRRKMQVAKEKIEEILGL